MQVNRQLANYMQSCLNPSEWNLKPNLARKKQKKISATQWYERKWNETNYNVAPHRHSMEIEYPSHIASFFVCVEIHVWKAVLWIYQMCGLSTLIISKSKTNGKHLQIRMWLRYLRLFLYLSLFLSILFSSPFALRHLLLAVRFWLALFKVMYYTWCCLLSANKRLCY